MRSRWHICLILTATASTLAALCAGCVYVLYEMAGPIRPYEVVDRLHRGMPEEEVEQLIGPPTRKERGGSLWVYKKRWNPGWLTIDFDDAGKLAGYDHEPTQFP